MSSNHSQETSQSGLVTDLIAGNFNGKLRLEGWSLHERLRNIFGYSSATNNLEDWRRVVSPDSPNNFDKRLEWDGLTPAQAASALAPNTTQVPGTPPWWPLLEELRNAARQVPGADPLGQRGQNLPFVQVWRPSASWALQTLRQRCADLMPQLQLSEAAWLDLAEALLVRFCSVADQVLLDLFNKRRSPGQMLLAHLGTKANGSREPLHEVYDDFVAELLSTGYGLLLEHYPVLGRLLAVMTALWLESSEEMLHRLAENRDDLSVNFAIPSTADLEAIQLGLSDPHRGGRVVAILRFGVSEDAPKVVYKPKDMQVDLTYQQLLEVLNNISTLPPLRSLKVVCRQGYGFMEWVEHRPCKSESELRQFYINAGRTMAILHLFGCTDCHYENLIASGDQLMLIDTETLLEADLNDLVSDHVEDSEFLSSFETSMQDSVLRSGLLPQWLMAGAGRKRAFDISALGIQPPPPELEQPGWLALNSDGMMIGRSTKPCELPSSLPVSLGSEQRLTDFVDQLCDGFVSQLQEAIQLRTLLLEALQAFRGKPRRLVARATRVYFTIQRQMLEPTSLRSAVAHGLKLEQLSRSFVLANQKPPNWPLFEAEVRQMERLDIPFFEHLIDGEDLPLPEGLAPIPGFMKRSGLAAARRRLERLDQAEINFQQQLVRGAIQARHLKTNPGSAKPSPTESHPVTQESLGQRFTPELYRKEALYLADQLWEAAIRDRKGLPAWLGMDLAADGEAFHFGLIGDSLYSGGSGIALALARLGCDYQTGSTALWRDRAWACFQGLANLAERNSNEQLFRLMRDLPYGISGSGGILLALALLLQVGITEGEGLASQLIGQIRPERLLADEGLDVIGGVTGLIGPLLLTNQPRAQELALVCGERLLTMQLENGGWANNSQRPPLTGFSHGAAGMGAALARLFQATGERRFAEAARRAVAYERSVYVAERGNWPDFRSTSKANEFVHAWCNGAPGILLSRLVIQVAGLADEQTSAELQAARSSTVHALARMAQHQIIPAHLCCGLFGLTSLLRLDALISGTALAPQVPEAEAEVVNRAQVRGDYTFFSVDSGSLNLPGLFTGKAGVVLALQEAANGIHWIGPVLSAGMLAVKPG